MKNLYLIRHAKSSWAEIGKRDFDRSLNDRGHHDAPNMAKLLRGLGVVPDKLVSSPAKRAHTTAQYFAKEFGIDVQSIDLQQDIYEAEVSDILHIVRELPNTTNTVLLFGHNPTFTYVANRFTSEHIDNVPTCGIVLIQSNIENWADFNEKNARQTGFWYPKM